MQPIKPQQPMSSQQLNAPQPPRSAMAITGLVLGIIALLTSLLPIINNLSFLVGLLGLIFSIVGIVACVRGKRMGKGMAIAALIVNILAVVLVLGSQAMYTEALDDAAASLEESTGRAVADQDEAPQEDAADKSADKADEPKPDVPTEYRSALKKAETYSQMMHMSKQGIYDQLTSDYGEQFSSEAAEYAIENLKADYKDNALEKAKTYQDSMSMSPEAIRDQLASEYGDKFTQGEADYAVENLG